MSADPGTIMALPRRMAPVGDAVDQLLVTSTKQSYQLYVIRIPPELTKDGLLNIFGKYGKVLAIDLMKPITMLPNSDFTARAKITFATLEEAQNALENLHCKAPHYLIIKHSFTPEERDRKRIDDIRVKNEITMVEAKMEAFHKTHGLGALDPDARLSERARQLAIEANNNKHQPLRAPYGTRGLSPYHMARVDMSGFSSGREDEWIQAQLKPQRSASQPPVEAKFETVEFDERPFTHGYPVVLPHAPVEACSYCGKGGRLRCSVCKEWYCSQQCQVNDWPRHRSRCIPPPPLEKLDGTIYRQPSRTLRQPAKSQDDKKEEVESCPNPPIDETKIQEVIQPDAKQEPLQKIEPTEGQVEKVEEAAYDKLAQALKFIKSTEEAIKDSKAEELPIIHLPDQNVDSKLKGVRAELSESEKITASAKPVTPAASEPLKVDLPAKPETTVHESPTSKRANSEIVVSDKSSKPELTVPITRESTESCQVTLTSPVVTPLEVTSYECLKTVLDITKESVELVANLEENDQVSIFNATVVNEDVVNYIMVTLQADVKQEPLKDITVGQAVCIFSTDEESYGRFMVVQIEDDQVEALDIDMLKYVKADVSKVYPLPHMARELPSLGCVVSAKGPVSESLTKMIKFILTTNGMLAGRVSSKVIRNGILKSLEVTVDDAENKPLSTFTLKPWTSMPDPRIHKALGISNKVMLSDLLNQPIKEGDRVIKIGFGHSSNLLIVMNVQDKEAGFEEKVFEVMANSDGPALQEVVKGQVVSCQWSEDDAFYRAVVTDIIEGQKAKVRFIDYGNLSVEPLARVHELPDAAIDFPVLAKLVRLDNCTEASTKDIKVANKLAQLEPLFEFELKVLAGAHPGTFKLMHQSGKTVSELVSEKLSEESPEIPPKIQGEEFGGCFMYDKAHVATINVKEGEAEVCILFADSPSRIFVCPVNQIGIAEKIMTQVANYCAIDEKMTGFAPKPGQLCLAKSAEDASWYRAACIKTDGDSFEMFFVDYGFQETLKREQLKAMDPVLMESVFLANHCVLEGFEDPKKFELMAKKYGAVIEEKLPMAKKLKLQIVRQSDDKAYFVVKIPELLGVVVPEEALDLKAKAEKDEKIRKLQEELRRLQVEL